MSSKKLNRRKFLQLTAMAATSLAVAACGPKITETAAPPAEAPTEAPKAEPTKAPEKPTDTPVPAAEAPAEAPKPKYKESPAFAKLVAEGKLPPVDERLPEEPRVLQGPDGIGKYSERLNLITYGAFGDFGHCMLQGSFEEDNNGDIFPNFMKGYEVSDDKKTYTFTIRKGLKWSDGTPVTTKDVQFWYEDDALNPEISPSTPGFGYTVAGEFCKLEIVDDYTYKLSWSKPNPTFPYTLRYWAGMWFTSWTGTPAHYMKKFHKKYNPNVEEEAKKEGFDSWVAYYGAMKNSMGGKYAHLKPALNSWLVKEVTETYQRYVPNPYYWGVDAEGNQLPYFQEVLEVIVNDQETYNLKVVAGEADYAAFHAKLADMPLFVQGQEKGGYEVRRYKSIRGSDESFSFNFTYKDPVLAAIFQDPRWNQALSYAINREEIREKVFLGTGVPRQAAPNPDVSYFKPEWEKFCVEFSPEKANALLDEMGLDKRDAEGWRLRPDGKTLNILIEFTTNCDSPVLDTTVLVAQHWKDVGIKVDYKEIERELLFTRGTTNEIMCSPWHSDRTNESRLYVPAVGKIVADLIAGENPATNEWYRWHSTQGKEGIEPPADWKEHFNDIDAWHAATTDEEYKRLAQKIFDFCILKHLRVIGTVGFSTWPVMVKKGMMNIPKEGNMGDDTGFARSLFTETWFRA